MKKLFDVGSSGEILLKSNGNISLEETIHHATLNILQDTGIKAINKEATELFYSSGATVEIFDNHSIVKIPPTW
jgi:trimethylamine:corrinoid methyltransferase-like protein